MGLFYNNNEAGSGVAKRGRQKKPFFRFWEMFANKFWTFFKINLIYVLFCLPIVTFGPATAAMTALMRNIYLERPQFVCLKLLCDGVLRGSESMGCFMAATFTDLILRVVLAAILSNAMNDVTGIWYSWPGAWAVATVMSVIFYKSGIWAKKLTALTPEAEKEEIAEEELVDEILEEHVDMTPDK